ncbi:MAG: OmpH family outer membrane protein [Spirochaetales bacterium]|nr:OmpH family outer membrane protein [Spirochaetales bacterium]
MNRKKILLLLIIFHLSAVLLYAAQEITKIGVIDISEIYTTYFKDSRAVRELEELKQAYSKTIENTNKLINDLENKKLEASRAGKDDEVLKYGQQIQDKTDYLRDFRRIKSQEIKSKEQKLNISNEFLQEIADAIQKVAETEGYSLILKKNDPYIVYQTNETDITAKVLEYLTKNK